MTTLAYHAGLRIMAADTQITSCNRKFRTSKVRRLACGGLIGSTGSLADIMKIQRWAEAGFTESAKPEFEDSAEVECLVVTGAGKAFLLDDSLELMPLNDEFIALGSGGPYAMAAMACGQTPEGAVKIAARFDAATSEPVESWQLEAPVSKRIQPKKAAKKK